ncbi:hypothetical protein PHL073M02_44 [Propionibacterium phage PHL073M02]|nr:hypothetical protein PHL073M02_44 [Propionibacterium phage PHL073M02]
MTPLGGDVIFLTPVGVGEKNKHPTTITTPHQTNKTAPRID